MWKSWCGRRDSNSQHSDSKSFRVGKLGQTTTNKDNNISKLIDLHYYHTSSNMTVFCKLVAQNWHKSFALVRACSGFFLRSIQSGGVRTANNHRNLWLHSDASDSDFPRPVHFVVPANKVHAMMTNQISEPPVSNIDKSLDINVGMTPSIRGTR